ncbi:MAG: hypothetical protein PHQ22_00770 [Sulfuricurvum sp.]|nr:hypothetical protein [Sulfuricurvum sp.]MDD5385709.1 hypothetical protein [Sulfuricurvum sp.]
MHTLTLKVHDSVLDKIIYFLNSLPKYEVEIIEDKVVGEKNIKVSKTQDIFQKTSGLISDRNIDPIEWQRTIRNEW